MLDCPSTSAAAERCPLCDSNGPEAVLDGRTDHEYGVETRLRYLRCRDCHLVFAHPVPDAATLASFYTSYSTHAAQAPARSALGRSLQRGLRSARSRELQKLLRRLPRAARCLDYGCGAGAALLTLNELGAARVVGHEPDPLARLAATQQGLTVHGIEGDALAEGPFDLVLLDHVIEHLPDPISTLRSLCAAMAPGGLLLMRTPNTQSLLARWFGDRWRGWETPRHLWLFGRTSIEALAPSLREAGLQLCGVKSSNRMFLGLLHGSLPPPRSRAMARVRNGVALLAWPSAELWRWIASAIGRLVGEELLVLWQADVRRSLR